MLDLFAPEMITDPLDEFLSRQQAIGLADRTFSMNPVGLNPVEPGTFRGQPTRDNLDAGCALARRLQSEAVVLADPAPHLSAHMPGGIIPDEHEPLRACAGHLCADPVEKGRGNVTDRATIHKTQSHLPASLWAGTRL